MTREYSRPSSDARPHCQFILASNAVRTSAFVLAGFLFSQTFNTSAIAFTYDESVDGDLPNSSASSPIFPLDFGTNTFSGEHSFAYDSLPGDDFFDSFAFSVPAGGTLVSMTVDTSLQPVGSGVFSSTDYRLQNAIFATIDSTRIPIPSSGLSLFGASLPLAPGQYAMADIGHSGSLVPGEFRLAAYTFTLTVAVPEPSTLVFCSLGLIAIGRRRRASTNNVR